MFSLGEQTIFGIVLNDNELRIESTNFIQSVIVHELGHALCLDDNPSNTTTPNASIMNHRRTRDTIYVPQLDDINGVKNAYNLK